MCNSAQLWSLTQCPDRKASSVVSQMKFEILIFCNADFPGLYCEDPLVNSRLWIPLLIKHSMGFLTFVTVISLTNIYCAPNMCQALFSTVEINQ